MELPIAFIEQMKALLPTEYEQFFEAMQTASPVSVRLNDKAALTPLYNKVAHCDSGYYLPERPVFTLDPWFHAGVYYVQEAGSMYLEYMIKKYFLSPSTMLRPSSATGSETEKDKSTNRPIGDVLMTEGNNQLTPNSSLLTPNYLSFSEDGHAIRALDLCAAPGGKSTHLASLLPKNSLLISNEVMPQRAHILAENASKWGYGNMQVTNNQAKDFGKLSGYFDLILTDVPCSGEGMFRKDEKAIEDWSADYVLQCAERQRSILSDVWPALKQDGLLIYSTCTFNRPENEDNVAWIAQELGAELLESKHFYFHTDQSEGLFMAALRKTAPTGNTRIKIDNKKLRAPEGKKQTPFDKLRDRVCFLSNESKNETILIDDENWCLKEEKDLIYALPKAYEADFALLDKHLRWVKKGIGIATLKGKNQTPHIDLALSRHLNKDAFTAYNLDLNTALHYLKGESVTLSDAPIGYLLLTYRGVPMGWGKNIGNRCNNLYPDAWRIRMNIPDTPCTLPF